MEAFKSIGQSYFNFKGKMEFLRLLKNPNDTQAIFRMSDAFTKATPDDMVERFMKRAYEDERLERAYQEQYWPDVASYEKLQLMPERSFGRELATFIERWSLDKDIFPAPQFASRPDYLRSRVYQAHDAWHVLTGYTPSVIDELALQAFSVGQHKQAISLLLVSGGLLHILDTSPEMATEALDAIIVGYERGKRSKNLLVHPVLERLEDPLDVVRSDLNIEVHEPRL